jgi:hypothetical protein
MATPSTPSSGPPPTSHHLNARLAHPHYLTSVLLTLPFPLILIYHLATTKTDLPPTSWTILSSLPLLLGSVMYQRTANKGLMAGQSRLSSEFVWGPPG